MRAVIIAAAISISGITLGGSAVDEGLFKAANKVGVPYKLLRAICYSESRLQVRAVAYSDGGGNNHALGMCQILYNTAVGMGMSKDDRCKAQIEFSKRSYKSCKLFGPYTNAYWAARVLRWQLDRYNNSWANAAAAYNSGTVKVCGKKAYYTIRIYNHKTKVADRVKKKCKPGGLMNSKYVDRVMKAMADGK